MWQYNEATGQKEPMGQKSLKGKARKAEQATEKLRQYEKLRQFKILKQVNLNINSLMTGNLLRNQINEYLNSNLFKNNTGKNLPIGMMIYPPMHINQMAKDLFGLNIDEATGREEIPDYRKTGAKALVDNLLGKRKFPYLLAHEILALIPKDVDQNNFRQALANAHEYILRFHRMDKGKVGFEETKIFFDEFGRDVLGLNPRKRRLFEVSAFNPMFVENYVKSIGLFQLVVLAARKGFLDIINYKYDKFFQGEYGVTKSTFANRLIAQAYAGTFEESSMEAKGTLQGLFSHSHAEDSFSPHASIAAINLSNAARSGNSEIMHKRMVGYFNAMHVNEYASYDYIVYNTMSKLVEQEKDRVGKIHYVSRGGESLRMNQGMVLQHFTEEDEYDESDMEEDIYYDEKDSASSYDYLPRSEWEESHPDYGPHGQDYDDY